MMSAEISAVLESYLAPLQFEAHPFLLGWYNEVVAPVYRLPYSDETLAYIIVSCPSSFEKALIPFYRQQYHLGVGVPKRDVYDIFMRAIFADLNDLFPVELKPRLIHDFDMEPVTRRPLVIMQTAAHIAGAAYYYDFRRELRGYKENIDELLGDRRLLGVCLHERFGGWFGLRGVVIFPMVDDPELPRRIARDVMKTDEEKLRLCEEFNLRYADNRYRDASNPEERYSDKQQAFWKTAPCDRGALLERWISSEERNPIKDDTLVNEPHSTDQSNYKVTCGNAS